MSLNLYKDRNERDDGGRYYAVVADYSRNKLYIARNSEQIYNYDLAEDTSDNPRRYNAEYFMEYGGDGSAFDSNSTPLHNTMGVSVDAYDLPIALKEFYKQVSSGSVVFRNQRGDNSTENPRLPLAASIPTGYPDSRMVGWQYRLLPTVDGSENKPAFGFNINSEGNLSSYKTYSVQALVSAEGVVNITDSQEQSFSEAAGYICFNSVGKTSVMPFDTTQFVSVKRFEAVSIRSADGVVEAAAILYETPDGWFITSTSLNGTTRGRIVEQLAGGNYRLARTVDYKTELANSSDVHPIQGANPLDVTDESRNFMVYRIGGPKSEIELPPPDQAEDGSDSASTSTDTVSSSSDGTGSQPDPSVDTDGRLLTNTELSPTIPSSEKRTRAQLYEALKNAEKYGDRTVREAAYQANVNSIGSDSFSHERIPEWAKESSQGELVSLVKALVDKVVSDKQTHVARISELQKQRDDAVLSHKVFQTNIIVGGYGYDN